MGFEAELQRQHGVDVFDNDVAYRPYSITGDEPGLDSPKLRVGVSGAQGTGITTTARSLAMALELPLLTEVARCAFEHGFTLGDKGSMKAQCAMWFSQLFLEHRAPSFVADRTVVDAVAHAEVLADLTGDREDWLIATAMGNATAAAMKDFTALFYTPIEFELTFDGVREGDKEFQERLHEKFMGLFERLQLPYVTVTGTPDERLDQARRHLSSLM